MPELDHARAELARDGIELVGLSLSDDPERVRAAAKRLRLQMPIAWTSDEILGPNGLRGVPSTLLIDGQGQVVDAIDGPADAAEIRRRLAAHPLRN